MKMIFKFIIMFLAILETNMQPFDDADLIIEYEETQPEDNFNPHIFTESYSSYIENVEDGKEALRLNKRSKVAKAFYLLCCCKDTKENTDQPVVAPT